MTDDSPDKGKHPRTQEANRSGDLVVLLGLIAVIVIASIGFTTVATHWMTPVAVGVMAIFMPLTAASFLHFRLPQKQKEFNNIIQALRAKAIATEQVDFVLRGEHRASDYLIPLLFVCALSALGFFILFANTGLVLFGGMDWAKDGADEAVAPLTGESRAFRNGLVAVGFAFMGAYVWSVQYVFRRVVTLDLPPGTYYSVGTRMIFSAFLALVFSHMTAEHWETAHAQLPAISFMAGIFPERLLAWMRDALGKPFAGKQTHATDLPLEMIEGISSFHKARLGELGIDNVQNLAHGSLVELMIKTPFKPRVLVDWMAQARLCLELKNDTPRIREAGVRSILDFQEVAENDLLEAIAEQSGLSLKRLQAIYAANKSEESISNLRKAYDVLNIV